MNKTRRKELTGISEVLSEMRDRLETEKDAEQTAYDNLPEGLQDGAKGDTMQAAIDAMDEASDALQQAMDSLDEAAA